MQTAVVDNVPASILAGNLALISHPGPRPSRTSFWFRDWRASGSKLIVQDDAAFGPVLGAMYTVNRGILKMTAQMPVIGPDDSRVVRLEVRGTGSPDWRPVGQARIVVPGYTATFKITDWDSRKQYQYRLVYSLRQGRGKWRACHYNGIIRRDPVDKETLVVAAFTGNLNTFRTVGSGEVDFTDAVIFFPHRDVIDAVKKHKPDLLVYTGDQIYEHRPNNPDRSGKLSSFLDYHYKWSMFLWAHGELTRNTPTVCLPDDHDVYHINLWGMGGKKARPLPKDGEFPPEYEKGHQYYIHDAGYVMPPEFVNMVQRTQTSHLPDPYDPTPVEQGIGVFYTDLLYGGVSFAILEDRKFKSSPVEMVPEVKPVNGFPTVPGIDVRKLDAPGAKLLGERQLKFLRHWAKDWRNAYMKVALSQTVPACVTTTGLHGQFPRPGTIPKGVTKSVDMESNGWPQSGRNRALRELRRGFAFMIDGDQHLGTIVHHGIDDYNDAGYSFCVPAIANVAPRSWYPSEEGGDHQPGMPRHTGRYLDGFRNHITVWAASNPMRSDHQPTSLHDRATGYGIVRLNKKQQTITMECWPRYADPDDPNARQFPEWPKTIRVEDNYSRRAAAYLPTLRFSGMERPVVQVIDEANQDVVCTIRAKDGTFRPKAFHPGSYTIRVGEPGTDNMKTLPGVRAVAPGASADLPVDFVPPRPKND